MDILVENICPERSSQIANISLYRRSRVHEMSRTFQTVFGAALLVFSFFSLALGESTDACDTAQPAAFIRGIDSELTITDELLSLVPIESITT